jgi:hypothetical protein
MVAISSLISMNQTIIIGSSLPLHIISGVGCGGVLLLDEPTTNHEDPEESESKVLGNLENSDTKAHNSDS